jgi:hypothetical protein
MHFQQDGADRNHQDYQVNQELHDRPPFCPSLKRNARIAQPFRAGRILAFGT